MSKHWGFAAAVVVGSLLAGGCSGDSKNTGQPTSTAPPPSSATSTPPAASLTEPCSILSAEAVGKAFSISKVTGAAQEPQRASNGLLTYTCEYKAEAAGSPLGALLITATDGSVTPAKTAEAWLRMPGAQQVGGVGEAAVYSLDTAKKVAVFAAAKASGDKTVGVIFSGSTRATQEMLASLVKQAIDRV